MRATALATIAALTFAASAAAATAYDRPPVPLNGLTYDPWGQSTTKAESLLRERYAGIRTTYCTGIALPAGQSSSFVVGMTRYWDKLLCFGVTRSRAVFGLVFDAKGKYAWIIYRLRGATVRDLAG